jgi:AbrB family looped-hinge helix DNA binding protein
VTEVFPMPVKFTLKVAKVGNSVRVTLPKEIREHLDLQVGDSISMWADNSHVVIEKKQE